MPADGSCVEVTVESTTHPHHPEFPWRPAVEAERRERKSLMDSWNLQVHASYRRLLKSNCSTDLLQYLSDNETFSISTTERLVE